MKVLNGYSGIGGNRKKWKNVSVTAIESDPKIAEVYSGFFKRDNMVIKDVEEFLKGNYQKFDFIWLSPPCQANSRLIRSGRNRRPRFPDLTLYKLLLFLKHNFKGKYVIENVIPYYKPLIPPTIKLGRHLFWSNFEISPIPNVKTPKNIFKDGTVKWSQKLKKWLGLEYKGNLYYGGNHDAAQVLRNCVHPDVGEHIYREALKSM